MKKGKEMFHKLKLYPKNLLTKSNALKACTTAVVTADVVMYFLKIAISLSVFSSV